MSRRYELPWECQELRDWCICGMNHYHQNGIRRLFVSMTRSNVCITAEGPDEDEVFRELAVQATALNVVVSARDDGTDATSQAEQLRDAIEYALTVDDGISWLHAWQAGDPEAMSELNDWRASQ